MVEKDGKITYLFELKMNPSNLLVITKGSGREKNPHLGFEYWPREVGGISSSFGLRLRAEARVELPPAPAGLAHLAGKEAHGPGKHKGELDGVGEPHPSSPPLTLVPLPAPTPLTPPPPARPCSIPSPPAFCSSLLTFCSGSGPSGSYPGFMGDATTLPDWTGWGQVGLPLLLNTLIWHRGYS